MIMIISKRYKNYLKVHKIEVSEDMETFREMVEWSWGLYKELKYSLVKWFIE